MLMSLHKWSAAEMHLAELQVAVNREEFIKLQEITQIQVVSKERMATF
jgi:nicotinic acid mononucleotide adenylyltransferase